MQTPETNHSSPTLGGRETIIALFEERWLRGERPQIADYLPKSAERIAVLVELAHVDLEFRLKAGESVRPEEYLERFPELTPDVGISLQAAIAKHASLGNAQTVSDPAGRTVEADAHTVPGFEILGVLGTGGMGVVYKARQQSLDRLVALKMIRDVRYQGPEGLSRFRSEALALARLGHPNIVQVFEVGTSPSGPYVALEYCGGGSLAAQLAGTPLAAEGAARTVETLALAVAAMHRAGVLHRDLKPGNVLLASDGTPKVTDFGLAKRLDEDSSQTQVGQVLGTPSYMSPEQANGSERIGPTADVYALGAILYECLTGRPPFRGATVMETLDLVRKQEPVPPRQMNPALSIDLETICLKCLEKDPTKRYLQCDELAQDLQRWREGKPVLARRIGWTGQLRKWAARNPAIATLSSLLAVAFVGVCVALGFALEYASREKQLTMQTAVQAEEYRLLAIQEQAARIEEEKARADAKEEAVRANQVTDFLGGIFRASDPFPLTSYGADIIPASWQQEREMKAQDFLDRAVERSKSEMKAHPLARARLLATMGSSYRNLGYYDSARQLLEEALELRRSRLPANHLELAQNLVELGWLTLDTGDFTTADVHLREALRIQDASGAPQADRIFTRGLIAGARVMLNEREAIAMYHSVVKDAEQEFGRNHRLTLLSKACLLGALIDLGDEADPKDLMRLGGELIEGLNAQPDDRAKTLGRALVAFQSGIISFRMGQTGLFGSSSLDRAEAQFRESARIVLTALPANHIYVCLIRFAQAAVAFEREKYSEAKLILEEIIASLGQTIGLAHPRAMYMIEAYLKLLPSSQREAGLALLDRLADENLKRFRAGNIWQGQIVLMRSTYEARNGHLSEATRLANSALPLIANVLRTRSLATRLTNAGMELARSSDASAAAAGRMLLTNAAEALERIEGPENRQRLLVMCIEAESRLTHGDVSGFRAAIERIDREGARAIEGGRWPELAGNLARLYLWSGNLANASRLAVLAREHARSQYSAGDQRRTYSAELLAQVRGSQGQYLEAVALADEASAEDRIGKRSMPDYREHWSALLKLAAGKPEAYHRYAAAILTRIGTTSTEDQIAHAADTALVAPDLISPNHWNRLRSALARLNSGNGSLGWPYAAALALTGDLERAAAVAARAGPAKGLLHAFSLAAVAAFRGDRDAAHARIHAALNDPAWQLPPPGTPSKSTVQDQIKRLEIELVQHWIEAQLSLAAPSPPRYRADLETAKARPESGPTVSPAERGDRPVAQWVLENGGSVLVRRGKEELRLSPGSQLPKESFVLAEIAMTDRTATKGRGLRGRLAGLLGLESLKLPSAELSTVDFQTIASLPALRQLDLSDSNLVDADLQAISGAKALTALDLGRTRATDAGVAHLAGLPRLSSLDLSWTGATDRCLSGFGSTSTLKVLKLVGLPVSDGGLAPLSAAMGLQHLDLSETEVTGVGLKALRGLPELARIDLAGSPVTRAGLAETLGIPSLRSLNLSGTPIQTRWLGDLEVDSKLTWLNLSGTDATDPEVRRLVRFGGLETLLVGSTRVTPHGVLALPAEMASVQVLGLPPFVPDVPVEVVTKNTTLDPKKTYGRIEIKASGVTVDGNGARVIGSVGGPPKKFQGTGIEAKGISNVTVRNLSVRGFETGLRVEDAVGWTVEGCDFSGNFHDPEYGWGDNGRRGGIVLSGVRDSVLKDCRANRVWQGCVLVGCENVKVEGSDFSHCSDTGLWLLRSSKNAISNNKLDYGLRILPGEVHARDSCCLRVETGSNDNRIVGNSCTHGGDGIFIRCLNGWVSSGNYLEKNDCSFAINNGVECHGPRNHFVDNRANHCSYGFWMGGGDGTILANNEASHNGLPDGCHNSAHLADGPGQPARHAGIVFMFGTASHLVIRDNTCVGNNGAGIALVGHTSKWKAFHAVIEKNTLTDNRWGVYLVRADWIELAANTYRGNASVEVYKGEGVTNANERQADAMVASPPKCAISAPTVARVGDRVSFDASASRDPAGRSLAFRWDLGDGTNGSEARIAHTFQAPGFYRVGVTVTNGTYSDIGWRDLYVVGTEPEVGTNGRASAWTWTDPSSRVTFADDREVKLVGDSSIRADVGPPYSGGRVGLNFRPTGAERPNIRGKTQLLVWIRARNPNIPSWQDVNPILTLTCRDGAIYRVKPKGLFLLDLAIGEAREGWTLLSIPLAGGPNWLTEGTLPETIEEISFGFDSWGIDPFQIWLDGLHFE